MIQGGGRVGALRPSVRPATGWMRVVYCSIRPRSPGSPVGPHWLPCADLRGADHPRSTFPYLSRMPHHLAYQGLLPSEACAIQEVVTAAAEHRGRQGYSVERR
jgi:hypothetical protein